MGVRKSGDGKPGNHRFSTFFPDDTSNEIRINNDASIKKKVNTYT